MVGKLPSVASLALCVLLAATVPAEAFAPGSLSALKLSRPSSALCRSRRQRVGLRMQEESPWQWDAAKGQYFDPNSGIYYDPTTGEYITPDAPPPPPPPPKKAAADAGLSARELQMKKVIEKQRIQDDEKMRKGALALESNRVAVILGLLFIGAPTLVLLVSFLTGALPNPFDVCIEGGTNC